MTDQPLPVQENIMQIPSLPFKVLALGPFTPPEKASAHQEPIRIDPTSLDQVMEKLDLSLSVSVSSDLCRWDRLPLRMTRFKDFDPDHLIENHPSLNNLLKAKKFVEEANVKGLSEEDVYGRLKEWPDFPLEVRFERKQARERISSPVDSILEMVALPGEDSASPQKGQPFAAQIDLMLQHLMRSTFSDADFKLLESTWRGLQFLMKQKKEEEIVFEFVPVSTDLLEETLNHLLPRLVEDLPSLILLDLPFDQSPRSLDLLDKVALFSETLLTPCVCWITPRFLFLNQWDELGRLPFLPNYFEEPAFAKWRRLKGLSSAKWMALTCNRFLVRFPYGPDHRPKWVRFDEPDYLWVSPVWAAGSLVLQSLHETGWPTRFTEWQNMKLGDLALHRVDANRSFPTETNFSDERIGQFIRGGITPVVSPLNKDFAFIPKETTLGGSSLAYQLFLSRISHFLFCCKDHFEKDLEAGLLEQNLKKAFSSFWEKSGALFPNSFEISAKRQKGGQPFGVRIIIEPSRQMLPSGEKVELELNW